MNVHELDEAGRPKMGWCFVPSGSLVAGDIIARSKSSFGSIRVRCLSCCQAVYAEQQRRPSLVNVWGLRDDLVVLSIWSGISVRGALPLGQSHSCDSAETGEMSATVDRRVRQREGTRNIAAVQASAVEIICVLDLSVPDAFLCGQRCSLVQARV
jgi:hypothetical protein